MKPTQEQVIAWAQEARFYDSEINDDLEWFTVLATLAYEAGRKDENEACAKAVEKWDSMRWSGAPDEIRARGNT